MTKLMFAVVATVALGTVAHADSEIYNWRMTEGVTTSSATNVMMEDHFASITDNLDYMADVKPAASNSMEAKVASHLIQAATDLYGN